MPAADARRRATTGNELFPSDTHLPELATRVAVAVPDGRSIWGPSSVEAANDGVDRWCEQNPAASGDGAMEQTGV
jgi:hypothetical protein